MCALMCSLFCFGFLQSEEDVSVVLDSHTPPPPLTAASDQPGVAAAASYTVAGNGTFLIAFARSCLSVRSAVLAFSTYIAVRH